MKKLEDVSSADLLVTLSPGAYQVVDRYLTLGGLLVILLLICLGSGVAEILQISQAAFTPSSAPAPGLFTLKQFALLGGAAVPRLAYCGAARGQRNASPRI